MNGAGSERNGKKWRIVSRQDALTIFGIMILLIGLVSALLIYSVADNDESGVLGYEIIGGTAYPIRPEDSRKYLHDLQTVGGKAFVLIAQFQRWFTGLWHGKSLAYIVGGIAILLSAGFFYAANNISSLSKYDARGENNRGSP